MIKNKSFNIKTLANLWPTNIDWSLIFHNNNPIDLEIGMGRPHFFFDRALNFKERNIVGIEYKYEFVFSAQKRIVRDNIKNAYALHGDAWMLTPLLFAPESISSIMVNFPDPWWKMRHKRRLILNEVFLECLYKRLTPDGSIVLQTDVLDLFNHYCEIIKESKLFAKDDVPPNLKAKTHRERKCLEQNLTIYRGLFRKLITTTI